MSKLVALVVLVAAAGLAPAIAQSPADRYNADCGSVVPGSDQARSCAARREQLQASRPNC
ncbi:MAG: hypothetical protein FD152_1182 [Xanthobacteraceae bacterium]|nr:MAG: hypothetical protein FD152_1182 [Xanthobacteraceae bacterium]